MSRGFIIPAQNTDSVDYVRCAQALAISIRRVMPEADITLLTSDIFIMPKVASLFNHIIELPEGDLAPDSNWKLINDCQVYKASPYDYTIKLEADMFIPRSIEHWWDILAPRDLVVSSTIRNYKGEISTDRSYRKFIDDNGLPDCYNAITYFKKSDTAKEFFDVVRNIFDNWSIYKSMLKCNANEPATTDWAYALAAHIIGKENVLLPGFEEMSMVHMKRHINSLPTDNWTDTLVYECQPEVFRVHTYPQVYPFHYHIKEFSDILIRAYK